jgi:beta-glucanase (GH16 family)
VLTLAAAAHHEGSGTRGAGATESPVGSSPNGSHQNCSDGVDNDGDGSVDYPADPGCLTPATGGESASSSSAALPAGWRLVWSDEFNLAANTLPDRHNWSFDTGGRWGHGSQLQCYTKRPENASHDGQGNLQIVARRERYACSDTTNDYTSARIHSNNKREFKYGLIEARMKVPAGQGIWPAFWTLGYDAEMLPWPEAGEIDILEVIGREPTVAQRYVHGPTNSGGHWQLARKLDNGTAWHEAFHVFGIRWSENRIEFLVDGVNHGTITPAALQPGWLWAFNKPHYLLLNVAVGGPTSWPGAPDATTPFPAPLLVDWVRVYE